MLKALFSAGMEIFWFVMGITVLFGLKDLAVGFIQMGIQSLTERLLYGRGKHNRRITKQEERKED